MLASPTPTGLRAPGRPPRGIPGPSPLVRWALYAFVFSLPFDAPGRLPLELTTITGALFLAVTLLQPRACFGQRPAAFWWFSGYMYVYWLAYVVGGGSHSADAVRSGLFFLQSLLIFLACVNLMRYPGIARTMLKVLVVAITILALMTVLGIATRVGAGSQRVTVFGQNPNRAARALLVGLLAAIGLAYGRPQHILRHRFVTWPVVAVVGFAMVMGGSRGGLLAMAIGLWTFTIAADRLAVKVRNAVVAVFAIAICGWLVMRSPVMQRRMEQAQEGNLAGREKIFPAAWELFKEKPLIGWGPNNQYALATRLGLPDELWASRDTHNLVLEILTGTGITGLTAFFAGVWLCFSASWRARRGSEGILPFALMTALLAGNMSGNFIVFKLQWVVFAYALAAGTYRPYFARRAPPIPAAKASARPPAGRRKFA